MPALIHLSPEPTLWTSIEMPSTHKDASCSFARFNAGHRLPFKIFAEEANGAVLDSEQRHSSLEMNAYLFITIFVLRQVRLRRHLLRRASKRSDGCD
mmetsp:Transcript_16625/g.37335  ORF Transcript_16625/g.37335 Transcript_16625/m.37335 type:complete len:97 (-) Transcript_16625:43-333(-)